MQQNPLISYPTVITARPSGTVRFKFETTGHWVTTRVDAITLLSAATVTLLSIIYSSITTLEVLK